MDENTQPNDDQNQNVGVPTEGGETAEPTTPVEGSTAGDGDVAPAEDEKDETEPKQTW